VVIEVELQKNKSQVFNFRSNPETNETLNLLNP
jgi:hypothetical protein